MKKLSRDMVKKLKPYWKKLQDLEDEFYGQVGILEKEMQQKIGIEDLEFFQCDGDYVGIGNYSRTIKLIQSKQLEQ